MVSQQTASMEDYLERIALLSQGGRPVKVTEISKALGVKKPSVASALSRLTEAGLVLHERYGRVELTAEGKRIARDVYQRHEALRSFLAEILRVDPKIAEEDACRMEHALSPESQKRLARFVDFVLNCPLGEPEFLQAFIYFSEHGRRDKRRVTKCLKEKER